MASVEITWQPTRKRFLEIFETWKMVQLHFTEHEMANDDTPIAQLYSFAADEKPKMHKVLESLCVEFPNPSKIIDELTAFVRVQPLGSSLVSWSELFMQIMISVGRTDIPSRDWDKCLSLPFTVQSNVCLFGVYICLLSVFICSKVFIWCLSLILFYDRLLLPLNNRLSKINTNNTTNAAFKMC